MALVTPNQLLNFCSNINFEMNYKLFFSSGPLAFLAWASLSILFSSCNGCSNPDTINFENDSGNDIGFFLDGRDVNGTFNDREFILQNNATSIDFTEDIIADQSFPGEIAAFTKNRMPAIINPVTFQEGTDVERVEFQNETFLPFTVWVLDVNATNTLPNRMTETLNGLVHADQIWQRERVGLRLGIVRFVNVSGSVGAATLRDYDGPTDADYFDQLTSFVGYDADRINIYLIRKVNGSRTSSYTNIGENQILMGMYTGATDNLVHQITHCFSLSDANESIFSSRNVAHRGGNPFTTRQYFSEGQVYRCHVNPSSAINDTYNARPGEYQIDCPDNVQSQSCPAIAESLFIDGFGISN